MELPLTNKDKPFATHLQVFVFDLSWPVNHEVHMNTKNTGLPRHSMSATGTEQ